MSSKPLTAFLAAFLLAGATPAHAQTLGCPTPCPALAPMGWEGESRAQQVRFRSGRTGATLAGTVFAPPLAQSRPGASPVVVIVPGSGGTSREQNYHWSARDLAAHGYVVLGVDPQGVGNSSTFGSPACGAGHLVREPGYPYPCAGVPFQQRPGFNDAATSGIAFALGAANPFAGLVNRAKVGVAGHSLGAGAAASAQETDPRVGAIVAWDGLDGDAYAMDTNAPTHHLVNGHIPVDGELTRPNRARAPALGVHSDHETTSVYDTRPKKRLAGWYHWRAAGQPTMVVTLRGLLHSEYGQSGNGPADPAKLRRIQHYTRAWFDLHLKGDRGAAARLLAREVLGVPREQMLSTGFRSAIHLPALGIDCEDVRVKCPGVGPPAS